MNGKPIFKEELEVEPNAHFAVQEISDVLYVDLLEGSVDEAMTLHPPPHTYRINAWRNR